MAITSAYYNDLFESKCRAYGIDYHKDMMGQCLILKKGDLIRKIDLGTYYESQVDERRADYILRSFYEECEMHKQRQMLATVPSVKGYGSEQMVFTPNTITKEAVRMPTPKAAPKPEKSKLLLLLT